MALSLYESTTFGGMMDIHTVEAEALWKGAGGKPAELEALRAQFGPGMSFAQLASRPELASIQALSAFGGGGVAAPTTVADVGEAEPAAKPVAKAAAKPKATTRKK